MNNGMSKTALVDCTVYERPRGITTIEKTVIVLPGVWNKWPSGLNFILD